MRKRLAVLLILAMAVSLSVCFASADDDDRSITVNGMATVTVEADRASINLGVRTSAGDAAEASRENAQKVQSVMDALKAAGIAADHMTTAYYYVNAVYDYSSFSDEGVVKGYQVTNTLTVVLDGIDRVGEIIDLALDAGANSCEGISFQTTRAGEAYDQALEGALKEAERKAEKVAGTLGVKLGRLLDVTENYGNYSGARYAQAKSMDGAAAGETTQIVADGLDFSASVQMTFAIE